MSLKVGIVTEYYYPLLGGISENVHNTALRLRQKGHTVKIITSNLNGNGYRCGLDSSAEVIRIGHSTTIYSNGSLARLTIGWRLFADLKNIFRREKFDLLHLHSPLVPTLPMFALDFAKCATVGTFHTYFDRSLGYSVLKGTVQRRLINKLNGQIAVSRSCIDALTRFFRINARIIPNGVDISEFSPDVAPFPHFRDGKKNLLFLGRLDPRNGLHLMIEAFGLIKAKFPEVRLIIVGDGPLKKYYSRLVPDNLKRDIYLAGSVLAERNRYYASSDIFCSPVEKASFGVTLLEAMASGKPIVATDNCGYRELLDGNRGFLIRPRDPQAFADAVLELLRNRPLSDEMGKLGRAKALHYSWDKIVDEVVEFYEEVI